MSLYGWGLGLVGFLVVATLLSSPPRCVRRAGGRLLRVAVRATDRLRPVAPVDELAEDMARMMQRERLRRDIERVRRILRTDASMPATRQIGNRLAYAWLVSELEKIQEPWASALGDDSAARWSVTTHHPPRDVGVENLDLGWRR